MDIDIENLNYVTKEDTFNFRCTCCGACCRHRDDILLNAYDIVRMIKYLNMPLRDFIEKYCECYIGHSSFLPVVKLRPKGKNHICPLLNNGKCTVHSVKPTVCALFPLGRMLNPKTKDVRYFVQDINCGAKDKAVVVDDWLHDFSINEQCFTIWSEIIEKLSMFMRENPKFHTVVFFDLIFGLMYAEYSLEEDFVMQLQDRLQKVNELIKTD